MFNDDIYARHHRGSTPSIENPERRLEDWMRSCRSLDQHPYSLSEIQLLRQCVVPRIEFKHREHSAVIPEIGDGPCNN
ncbi:MAG: hypothetical protein JXA06_11655 [Bacteroidetes bacterium]|nr:hypothetical protein [Bacteroidota bacterium]